MIGGAGGQAAEVGAVAGDQRRIQRGAAAIGRGRPVFDLGVGGFIGRPADACARGSDAGGRDAADGRAE